MRIADLSPKQIEALKKNAFPKGRSGNPGGRPKGLERRVRELTNDGELAIRMLIDIVNGHAPGTTYLERIRAAEVLLRWGYGRPPPLTEYPVG